jgi:hypothetical protein
MGGGVVDGAGDGVVGGALAGGVVDGAGDGVVGGALAVEAVIGGALAVEAVVGGFDGAGDGVVGGALAVEAVIGGALAVEAVVGGFDLDLERVLLAAPELESGVVLGTGAVISVETPPGELQIARKICAHTLGVMEFSKGSMPDQETDPNIASRAKGISKTRRYS